jgi:hypothetical protein
MFEIAVATSSVNWPIRASVSTGKGSRVSDAVLIAPQSRPSTMIGAPTPERTPRSRRKAANEPSAFV